jgi:hypothetical protein
MATSGDFVGFIRQIVEQHLTGKDKPFDGVVAPGSWNPADGTIHVMRGETLTLGDQSDPDAQALLHQPIPLLTLHVGLQGAPIGYERVVVFPYDGGYVAFLRVDTDDSPNIQAGEVGMHLRSFDQSLVAKCFARVQNDATRLGHAQKVVVASPVFSVGSENTDSDNGISRKQDNQQLANDIISAVQQAFNQFAQTVQPGSGTAPPTVNSVTAQSSTTSYTV